METEAGNCLIAHVGNPTPVSNAVIAGCIEGALSQPDAMEEIYGAISGLQGILNEWLIDLAEQSQQTVRQLKSTPGVSLGSSHFHGKKLSELERMGKVFQAQNIRFLILIGDREALEAAAAIEEHCAEKGIALKVAVIPASVENLVSGTDHSLGYASAVKLVTGLVRSHWMAMNSFPSEAQVSILEIPGKNPSWIVGGSYLAKRRDFQDDPAILTIIPEKPFEELPFLNTLRDNLNKSRGVVVVVSESLYDGDGNYISSEETAGEYLSKAIQQKLAVSCSLIKPGNLIEGSALLTSETDKNEAGQAGMEATRILAETANSFFLSLIRGDGEGYRCEFSSQSIASVGTSLKEIPADWLQEEGYGIRNPMMRYLTPLVAGEVAPLVDQGILQYPSLNKAGIPTQLGPWEG